MHGPRLEHTNAWLNGKPEKSNFAVHLIGTGHVLEEDTGVALIKGKKGKILSKLKEIEIAIFVRNRNYKHQSSYEIRPHRFHSS